MKTWWVNQNRTYHHEVGGGYLWSPKTKANGNRNVFYDNMTEVKPGDFVLSFRQTYVRAIGVAESACYSHPKPDFGTGKRVQWDNDGWKVDVRFFDLPCPLRPREHMDQIGPVLPAKYGPLQANGDGIQPVYLAELSESLEAVLLGLIERAGNDLSLFHALSRSYEQKARLSGGSVGVPADDPTAPGADGRSRETRAFREQVLRLEPRCRLSGIENPQFLKVRHVKPWNLASESERFDPENGLTFAPHYAVLFSKGAIAVDERGFLVHSREVAESDFDKLDLPVSRKLWLGEFTDPQRQYLEAHREWVFRR